MALSRAYLKVFYKKSTLLSQGRERRGQDESLGEKNIKHS